LQPPLKGDILFTGKKEEKIPFSSDEVKQALSLSLNIMKTVPAFPLKT
jgi:hypothetical protein